MQQQLKENDEKWQERLREERVALEKARENDVRKVQEKYDCLLSEITERAERAELYIKRAEKRLEEKEREWLNKENRWFNMFEDLHLLSKKGEMSKMKEIIKKSISKQGSPCVSVPQSPNPHE